MSLETISTILWVALAILFGAWLVVSWVLSYHWRTYSRSSKPIKRASRIYYAVSLGIFIVSAILIASL